MRKIFVSRRGLRVAALVLFGATAAIVKADELTLTGSTTGVVVGVPPLTFAGTAGFTGTTALGVGSLSGANSLGTFFLSTAPLQLLGGTFDLNITFTAPTIIAGGQLSTFSAMIQGSVSPNIDQGGVSVTFPNPSQTFTFNDGINTGSFTFTVADLFVQSGRSASVTAGFTGSQSVIPEPGTCLLVGLGTIGLVATRLRRKRGLSC